MRSTSTRYIGLAAACFVLLGAAGPVAAAELGPLPACSMAAACTPGLYSSALYQARRDVNATPGYSLGPILVQGATEFQGSEVRLDNRVAEADNFPPIILPAIGSEWAVYASAKAQSDFAVNRAWTYSSRAVSGTDAQGSEHAQISKATLAQAQSAWHDVWRFSATGHFSAPVHADGSSTLAALSLYPSSYEFTPRDAFGDWYLDMRVWDMDNQTVSETFELGGPTQMARVEFRGNDEQRATFAEAAVLEFDFVPGVTYVVTSALSSIVYHGREIDLFHTARLGPATLSGGAALTALSGHDFVTAVPEPGAAALLLLGLATLAAVKRRRAFAGR